MKYHITDGNLFQEKSNTFTKDELTLMGERGTKMKRKIMIALYTLASIIDDIAYFVVGKCEDIECEIKTHWGEHYYC